ncbi:MAG TPA: energy transducer TonB, partial [Pyrinomonadaceae bacterium]|nr:energy transducer TonB [Pyrinomonadaceae bacterium]
LAFVFQGVKNNLSSFYPNRPYIHGILPTILLLITPVFAVAQSTVAGEDISAASNSTLTRIERARALAAVHQLQPAATELENVRASVRDVALRNVTTLMLIGIYLEDGNYGRSQSLLEEAFQTRAAQKDESIRTYFAAAGQTINGIRAHLARYRSFGLNPSETALPPEANTDLERVRNLLERVIAQANEISKEAGRAYDALALLEDVLGLRMSLARNDDDRAKWQTEFLMAREKMASSQIQVASLGRSPALDALTSRIPNPFATSATANKTETNAAQSAAQQTAPTQTTTTEPQLISTGSLSGRETKRVSPNYPQSARSHNVSGTVRVFAIIDENGKIWVTNSEGPILLRQAAEEAARGWTFPPSAANGKPVRLAGYIDFEFKL